MGTYTFRVLAVEPDLERAAGLRQLVQQYVAGDVTVVRSADAALARMTRRMPDVVLMSALLPPQEEAQLLSHLRIADPNSEVPLLTVPPVMHSLENPGSESSLRRRFALMSRVAKRSWPHFDPAAVGARIREALLESQSVQSERQLRLVHESTCNPLREDEESAGHLEHELPDDPSADALSVILPAREALRQRAHRFAVADFPWLSRVETVWGLDVRVLNISRSGMLIELPSKLDPGTSTKFRLSGPDTTLVVPARVVRSEVGEIDRAGVRYQTAAAFDQSLVMLPESPDIAPRSSPSPQALAEFLSRVAAELEHGRSAARLAFELGLRQLVPVSEIMVREAPSSPPEGHDSVYFTVPGLDGHTAVLQAVFEPNHVPMADDLKLLKVAAGAAAILFYEGPALAHHEPRETRSQAMV